MPKDRGDLSDLYSEASLDALIKAMEEIKLDIKLDRTDSIYAAIIDEAIKRMTMMYDHLTEMERQLSVMRKDVQVIMKRLDIDE